MLTAKMPPAPPRELPKNEMTQAVCSFVVDCGSREETNQEGKVKVVPKVMFIFELEQKRSDGLPFIMSQTFTNSLHKKANLRKFLEDWEGRSFSDAEVETGIPLEPFRGRNGLVNIVYNESKGKTYANIKSIAKLRDRDVPIAPTLKEIPKWVIDQIMAKAKVKPEGLVAGNPATAAFDDSVDLPF